MGMYYSIKLLSRPISKKNIQSKTMRLSLRPTPKDLKCSKLSGISKSIKMDRKVENSAGVSIVENRPTITVKSTEFQCVPSIVKTKAFMTSKSSIN